LQRQHHTHQSHELPQNFPWCNWFDFFFEGLIPTDDGLVIAVDDDADMNGCEHDGYVSRTETEDELLEAIKRQLAEHIPAGKSSSVMNLSHVPRKMGLSKSISQSFGNFHPTTGPSSREHKNSAGRLRSSAEVSRKASTSRRLESNSHVKDSISGLLEVHDRATQLKPALSLDSLNSSAFEREFENNLENYGESISSKA